MPEEPRPRAKTRPVDTGRERARAIVTALGKGEPSSAEVFDAFWELDALPADDVRDALTSLVGPPPDLDRLDTAARRALRLPLRLRTLSVERDADLLDLGPVAEEQLRLAGKSWDGVDLAPEERLDGELDGSLAGTVERRVLADGDAPGETPLFDVLLFGEDSGVVFAAGTTKIVALIAYRKVEMRDARTRAALEEAIAAPVPAPSVEPLSSSPVVRVAAEKPDAKVARAAKGRKNTAKTAKTAKKAATKKPAAKATRKAVKTTTAKATKTKGGR